MLLTLGADFTTHGLLLKADIYQILGFSSHGLNPQEIFLSLKWISAALHGSNFHRAAVYISDSVEYIILLPKRKIPLDIRICLDSEVHMHRFKMLLHRRTKILLCCCIMLQIATKDFASF